MERPGRGQIVTTYLSLSGCIGKTVSVFKIIRGKIPVVPIPCYSGYSAEFRKKL
jgi:hypothetical protein